MRCRMIVRNGQHVGQTFYVDDGESKIVGRDASCDFQMYDKGLSRNHSLIESRDGQFILSDLGSTNGTFVNGKMVISKPLEDGDLINVGKIQLQFFLERDDNPLSTSVRMVDDNKTIGPQSIMRRLDIDSVMAHLEADSDSQQVHAPQPGLPGMPTPPSRRDYEKTLKTLHDVSVALNAVDDLSAMFEQVMDLVMGTVRAERGFAIHLKDGEQEVVLARSRSGGPASGNISRTVVTKCVGENLCILSNDAASDDRFKGGQSIILNQIKSVMCVPLKGRKQILGAIYVDCSGSTALFGEADLELLSIIGMQAGIAAERIELHTQVLQQAAMKQSLEVARSIQRSFLPQGMPDARGLDIVGWSESCDETGGDYYDFVTHPDGRLGLAVGDISGHGIGAALLMASARASLRALVSSNPTVDALFGRLNHLLEHDLADDQFMTFFYGVLDPSTWRMVYTSAGHESPVLLHVQSDTFEDLPSLGVPLGMLPDYPYPAGGPIQFEVGDVLVLMTDGITEAMNHDNEEFGRDRLLEVVKRSSHMSANQIVGAIHQAVTEFAGGRPARDDLTLVVVRFEQRFEPDVSSSSDLDELEVTRSWANSTQAD